MIEFFAGMFLVGLIGFIIFIILLFIFRDEVVGILAAICLVVMIASGIGIEVEKMKEPKHCNCSCCSVCDTEMIGRR